MSDELGKKIFFLYPHSIIHDELFSVIIENEYEAYILKDYKKAINLLSMYSDSILFINIDTELKESEWIEYVKALKNNPGTKDVQIGILTFNENKELEKKYLLEIGVSCGFIKLKLGLEDSKNIILKTLSVNEAHGRRKYIRIKCENKNTASFNIKTDQGFFSGSIIDLSSVGMACIFDPNPKLLPIEQGLKLNDIQLRLKGVVCKTKGVVVAERNEKTKIYVVMFNFDKLKEEKEKIHNFIKVVLHEELEKELSALNS